METYLERESSALLDEAEVVIQLDAGRSIDLQDAVKKAHAIIDEVENQRAKRAS